MSFETKEGICKECTKKCQILKKVDICEDCIIKAFAKHCTIPEKKEIEYCAICRKDILEDPDGFITDCRVCGAILHMDCTYKSRHFTEKDSGCSVDYVLCPNCHAKNYF